MSGSGAPLWHTDHVCKAKAKAEEPSPGSASAPGTRKPETVTATWIDGRKDPNALGFVDTKPKD